LPNLTRPEAFYTRTQLVDAAQQQDYFSHSVLSRTSKGLSYILTMLL